MKRFMMITALLVVTTISLPANPLNTGSQFGFHISASFGDAGYFYRHLSPYGEWIEIEPGFYVWRPLRVRVGWRPYLYGRWVWTDYGWYWVSSEPFGWAVFHYGRWYYDDFYGWVWVPDRIWGPAWVEWRYNDDYIGWAPLPPYASFSFSIGIRFTTRWVAPVHYWNFVRYRHFSSPYVVREVVPVDYTRRLIGTTRTAGRYEVDGDRVINRGVDRNFVERRGFTRINRVEVSEGRDRGERLVRERDRERIEVFRPDRSEPTREVERIEARRAERRLSLDLDRIERPRGRDNGRGRMDGRDGEAPEGQREEGRERFESRERERRTDGRPDRGTINRWPPSDARRDGFPPSMERRERREEERPHIRIPEPPSRRETMRERPIEGRREVSPPSRQRTEPQRAPERRESPRGSEQRGGRERRRDG